MNDAGFALLLIGLLFMAAEAFVPSFGALGLGGLLTFGIGWVLLLENGVSGIKDAWPLLATIALAGAVAVYMAVKLALKARRRPVVTGMERLVGSEAEALEDFSQHGWVRAEGERWQAHATERVHKGARLRIIALDGLILHVEPAENVIFDQLIRKK